MTAIFVSVLLRFIHKICVYERVTATTSDVLKNDAKVVPTAVWSFCDDNPDHLPNVKVFSVITS